MNPKDIIRDTLEDIMNDIKRYANTDSCIPCKIISNISKELELSESDAGEILSNILANDIELYERFIEVMENVHMRIRNKALNFYSKSREGKDRYLELYIRNAITELRDDTRYSKDIVIRRLVLNYLSTYLAQTLGLDFHASTEEVYYILRKNSSLEDFIKEFTLFINNERVS